MRTTVIIEDRLLREARRRAASRGVTLSDLVGEALRAALRRPQTTAPSFQMITYGERLPTIHREPEDFAAALEDQDRGSVER